LNLFQYRSLQFTHFNFGTLWRRHRFFSSQDTKLKHQLNFEPLVNWFQANLLMIFTTIMLIGIPAVIVYMVWGGKKSDSSSE